MSIWRIVVLTSLYIWEKALNPQNNLYRNHHLQYQQKFTALCEKNHHQKNPSRHARKPASKYVGVQIPAFKLHEQRQNRRMPAIKFVFMKLLILKYLYSFKKLKYLTFHMHGTWLVLVSQINIGANGLLKSNMNSIDTIYQWRFETLDPSILRKNSTWHPVNVHTIMQATKFEIR